MSDTLLREARELARQLGPFDPRTNPGWVAATINDALQSAYSRGVQDGIAAERERKDKSNSDDGCSGAQAVAVSADSRNGPFWGDQQPAERSGGEAMQGEMPSAPVIQDASLSPEAILTEATP